jgi:hypothetical protein
MRIAATPILFAAALLVGGPAAATPNDEAGPREAGETTVEMRLRTLLLPVEVQPGWSSAGWPLYQWMEVTGRGPYPGLSVHTAVWGLGALGGGGDRVTGDPLAGDVTLLYAQYQDPRGRYAARLGRQMIFAGPGAGFFSQVDGLWVRGALANLDVQAYGGQVVLPRFSNFGAYDWLAGGRVGYHRWHRASGGLSYLHARTRGALAREIAGADAAVVVTDDVDVVLTAVYDLVDPGLMESRAMARWTVLPTVTTGLVLEQASPARYIDKSSIFSVFALGDYGAAEAFAEWAFRPEWVVRGRAGRVFFVSPDGGFGRGEQANRFGAGVRGWLRHDVLLLADVDRLPSDENAYTSLRVASRYRPVAEWSGAVDLLAYFYDHPPLSRPGAAAHSLTARAFYDRHLGRGMHLGVGAEVGQTVLSTADVRGFLRFTTGLDFAWGGAP